MIKVFTLLFFQFLVQAYAAPSIKTEAYKESSSDGHVSRFADVRVLRNSPIQVNNFWTDTRYKWPGGVIPYLLSPQYTISERNIILAAMSEWEKNTCVRFVPRQSQDRDYVEITPTDGTSDYCYCWVGRIGGRQIMKMYGECIRSAAMIHELGHAIGFNHEHQRPDRDGYINVHYANIDPVYHYAFEKFGTNQVDTLGTPYDYKSVMQYPYYAFTNYDPNKPAMTLKDGSIDAIRQEAQHLSVVDIQKTQLYYNNCKLPLKISAS